MAAPESDVIDIQRGELLEIEVKERALGGWAIRRVVDLGVQENNVKPIIVAARECRQRILNLRRIVCDSIDMEGAGIRLH